MSSRCKVEFAGVKLHDIVHISRIATSILPKRNNFSIETPSANGSSYSGFRYGERIFHIEIGIKSRTAKDFNEIKSNLANALNINIPSKLIINDSDIIYYAVIDGDTDINKLFQFGKSTLTFICYDPMGYSKYYISNIMDTNKNFIFSNMGTYNSYPIIGFEFSKPSSFVYLANENKESVLIGRIKDNTVETIQNKSLVIDDDCTDSSVFTNGGNVTVSDNRVVSGAYGVGNYGASIVATNYGPDVQNKWIGPTFRKNLDRNLEEFEVKVNLSFSSHGKNFNPPNVKDLVKVAKKSGTYMYTKSDPNSAIILSIPFGTDLSILEFTKNKMCKVIYSGKTGYIKTDDVWRINKSNSRSNEEIEWGYAEEQMGLIEVMGFDSSGQLLFRFHIRDNNKYFEHVIPEVYIKDKLYLHSNTTVPTPNTINMKDDNGNPIGTANIASGMFGDWNDYTGTFTIRRKKLENGKYRWWAKISRTNDGVNENKEINMGAGIINDSLPTGKLNHLVFYISKFSGVEAVSVMTVNHIKVNDISNEDKKEEVNVDIFQQGDCLEIDFENCEVTLNGDSCMDKLDIGSSFFSVGKNSIVSVRSDDENIKGTCSYRKRYL
ncbi:MAG TPA: phage tail family protein [Clostridium perfringens]|nr:phage tail family protein [Clostridium perfringens]